MYFIGTLARLIYIHDTRLSDLWFQWFELALTLSVGAYILYLFRTL